MCYILILDNTVRHFSRGLTFNLGCCELRPEIEIYTSSGGHFKMTNLMNYVKNSLQSCEVLEFSLKNCFILLAFSLAPCSEVDTSLESVKA